MINIHNSKDLLGVLRQSIRNEVPRLSDEDRKIWFNAGRVSVLQEIERLLEEDKHGDVLRE